MSTLTADSNNRDRRVYGPKGYEELEASEAGLPPMPTSAAPGTAAKIRVMKKRANRKLQVFHPADARFAGDPRPLLWIENLFGGSPESLPYLAFARAFLEDGAEEMEVPEE